MKVFKFGGASVKNADGVRNVAKIIQQYSADNPLVVISAIGDTTNKLEQLCYSFFHKQQGFKTLLDDIKKDHYSISLNLLGNDKHPFFNDLNNTFVELDWILEDEPHEDYNFVYDQIVSMGEVLSTKIVDAYLQHNNINSTWVDARNFVQTDNNYREAHVDWELTQKLINGNLKELLTKHIVITQGFIGGTSENYTTTLGREGSDFTAAIFAYCLDSESVIIWKDVPGVLNADPKWFDDTVLVKKLTYNDAIELAYYGATVIHPKTIKPLQNKNIPLLVRSFVHPDKPGTVVSNSYEDQLPIPCFIFKMKQRLISVHPKDFSFINENGFGQIFNYFAEARVKINVMQNTAISFSVTVDESDRVQPLIEKLRKEYKVLYNTDMELITIRYYNQDTINRVLPNKRLFIEQKSRYTVQLVVQDMG